MITSEDAKRAVAALDAINAGWDSGRDWRSRPPVHSEAAHRPADAILLELVPPEVAEAYRRLVDERVEWWAFA